MSKTNLTVTLGNLKGPEGNAFIILARVSDALEGGGRGDLVECFLTEAKSGNYQHLLETCEEYVNVRATGKPKKARA